MLQEMSTTNPGLKPAVYLIVFKWDLCWSHVIFLLKKSMENLELVTVVWAHYKNGLHARHCSRIYF